MNKILLELTYVEIEDICAALHMMSENWKKGMKNPPVPFSEDTLRNIFFQMTARGEKGFGAGKKWRR